MPIKPEDVKWDEVKPEDVQWDDAPKKKGLGTTRSAFQQQAAKRLAENLQKGASETYKQDITNAGTHFAGQVAENVAFGAAGLATGGASIPVALGLMGATGVAAGIAREGIKAFGGATDTGLVRSVDPSKALALSLGIDAGTGMFGEGLGRGIGFLAKAALPKFLVRSAAKSVAGRTLLDNEFSASREALYAEIKNAASKKAALEFEGAPPIIGKAIERSTKPRTFASKALLMGEGGGASAGETATEHIAGSVFVDVGPTFDRLAVRLKARPSLSGGLGQELTNLSPTSQGMLKAIASDQRSRVTHGVMANLQPLDGVIEARQTLQKAWHATEGEMSRWERTAFKQAYDELGTTIRGELKDLSPKAVALFEHGNDLAKVQRIREGFVNVTERVVRHIVMRAPAAALGGAIGYREGGIRGGVAGAAVGVAGDEAIKKVSPWILERVWASPTAKASMMRAVDFYFEGKNAESTKLALRAFGIAGVRNLIKDYASNPEAYSSQQQGPPLGQR